MSFQSIRRAVIASGLVIGAVAAFSPAAFAAPATDSDSVPLAGTVDSTLAITATPTLAAGDLELTAASEQIVKVADLAILTNNTAGYTLSVGSGVANSGNLTNGNGDTIAFQSAAVADGASGVTSAAFTEATGDVFTDSSTTSAGSNPKDLYIMYTPSSTQGSGDYTGSISLTVTDNS